MNRECVSHSPCRNGLCINGVGRYFCDCAGTEYAGSLCNDCKYFIIEPEYRVMINTGSLFNNTGKNINNTFSITVSISAMLNGTLKIFQLHCGN
jgi:hypothetical protein